MDTYFIKSMGMVHILIFSIVEQPESAKDINKGILPHQPYYIESCRRLLSKKEFEKLKPKRKKPKYLNQPQRI